MQLTPVLEARVLVLNFAGNFHGQGRSVHYSRSLNTTLAGEKL